MPAAPVGSTPGVPDVPRLKKAVRAPFAVCARDSLELSTEPVWVDCDLAPGQVYRLQALAEGGSHTTEDAALIAFDGGDAGLAAKPGWGLSASSRFPEFTYLRTGPGILRTDRLFSVGQPIRRVGLSTWSGRGPVTVKAVTVELVEEPGDKTQAFLSFDVEGLRPRADADWVNRLVWGKVAGGEFGIRRICSILRQYRLRANFMVDMASCRRDGDAGLRTIMDFLQGEGHEVHVHLHPEELAASWKLRRTDRRGFNLDTTSYETSRALLDYAFRWYEQATGRAPRVFRSGSYRQSRDLVLAAGSLGIEALTNYRDDTQIGLPYGGDLPIGHEIFTWDNGLIDIPVDVSSPETSKPQTFEDHFKQSTYRKRFERTFNIVMHSWSLMHRDEKGHYDGLDPANEQRVHEICEHVVQHGGSRGYGEYLDARKGLRPVRHLRYLAPATPLPAELQAPAAAKPCNICDCVYDISAAADGECPGCGSRIQHRQLRDLLDVFGNVFDGRNIVVPQADPVLRRAFLLATTSIVIRAFDKLGNIRAGSVEAFLAIDTLHRVPDDRAAVDAVARILKTGAVFVSTVPFHREGPTRTAAGDGSRDYNLDDYTAMLDTAFVTCALPAVDPVTKAATSVVLAYRR